VNDTAEQKGEETGDTGAERIAPVHHGVGERTPVGTAVVVEKVGGVEDGVDGTDEQWIEKMVDSYRDGVGEQIDDDVDGVQRVLQLSERRQQEILRRVLIKHHNVRNELAVHVGF